MQEVVSSREQISLQDYLDGEPLSEVRHEYIGGRVYARAGGTRRHSQIALNIAAALLSGLEDSPCTVYGADVKVHLQTLGEDLFYYPDVMIGCDPTDNHDLYLERPTTIFEVLSDSTERTDRREKFHAYRSISSLKEYVLVSQDHMEITVARSGDDWAPEIITYPAATLELPGIDQSLPLSKVYQGIDFG